MKAIKKAKKIISLGVVVLLIGLSLVLINHFLLEHSSLNLFMQVMKRDFWILTTCRYVVYGLLIVAWPYLINKWGWYRKWPADAVVYLSDQRIKLFLFFITIEVLFVYNLLGHLMVWL